VESELLGEDDEWWDRALYGSIIAFPPCVETIEEFRFAARCLRDMFSAWLMLKNRVPANEFVWVSPRNADQFERTQHIGAGTLLAGLLNVFLGPFRPALIVSQSFPDDDPERPEDLLRLPTQTTVEALRGPEAVPLIAICALELFNHITENTE